MNLIALCFIIAQTSSLNATGYINFYYEEDRRVGFKVMDSLLAPPRSGMVNMGINMDFYGYPVFVDLVFTSEARYTGTLLNRYSVRFEPSAFGGNSNLITNFVDFLNLGDVVPFESELVMNRMGLRGLALGVRPRRGLAIRVYYGQTRRKFGGSAYSKPSYSRTLGAVFLKVMPLRFMELDIHLLRGGDHPSSDIPSDTIPPLSNSVVGGSINLNYGQKLKFRSELNISAVTNLNGTPFDRKDAAGNFFKRIMPVNISTYIDWAYFASVEFRPDRKLRTEISYRYVGPGYSSFGAAFFRSDWQELEFEGELRGWGNPSNMLKLELSHGQDNLVELKDSTQLKRRAGILARILLAPNFYATANFLLQNNLTRIGGHSHESNSLQHFLLTLFRHQQIWGNRFTTSFSFASSAIKGAQNSRAQSVSVNSNLQLTHISLSLGLSFSNLSSRDTTTTRALAITASAASRFMGQKLGFSPCISTNIENGNVRTGISISINFQPVDRFQIGLMFIKDLIRNDFHGSGWLLKLNGHTTF